VTAAHSLAHTETNVALGVVLCAAARAIESMRADALFTDPFAKLLAGPKAMARHQVRPGWGLEVTLHNHGPESDIP
jgi:O-methyltransferase involved in polyketide biosynthesis